MITYEVRSTTVETIMTADPITILPTGYAGEIDDIFTSQSIHHIPVVDQDGHFIGIVSDYDVNLLKDIGSKRGSEKSQRLTDRFLNTYTARDIMTADVQTVSPEDTLAHCARIFGLNRFHALPVLKEGRLVGLITTYDLIKAAYI